MRLAEDPLNPEVGVGTGSGRGGDDTERCQMFASYRCSDLGLVR
jgi:hypothetical protein